MKTRWPYSRKSPELLERRNDDRKLNTFEHVLQAVNKTSNVVGGLFQISVHLHESSSLRTTSKLPRVQFCVSHRLHFDITSNSRRLHFENSMSLRRHDAILIDRRVNLDSTTNPLRIHFCVFSMPFRVHLGITSSSLQFRFAFILTSPPSMSL